MNTKLTKNALKTIVKECLVEILAEGIVTSAKVKKQPNKKSKLNSMLAESTSNNAKKERVQSRNRPSYLDNIKYNTPASDQKESNIKTNLHQDPVMNAIFADTAKTTLQEQVAAESRKGMVNPGPRSGDAAAQVANQSDPTELFGSASQKWAQLAFADTIKKV